MIHDAAIAKMTTKQKAFAAAKLRRDTKYGAAPISYDELAIMFGWKTWKTAQSYVSRANSESRWDYHMAQRRVYGRKQRCTTGKQVPERLNWTPMEEVLRNLWPEKSGEMIARVLTLQFDVRVTRSAVCAKARRLKLTPKPSHPEKKGSTHVRCQETGDGAAACA
jgi:transposase